MYRQARWQAGCRRPRLCKARSTLPPPLPEGPVDVCMRSAGVGCLFLALRRCKKSKLGTTCLGQGGKANVLHCTEREEDSKLSQGQSIPGTYTHTQQPYEKPAQDI